MKITKAFSKHLRAYETWVRSMWNWNEFVSADDFQADLTPRDDYLMATGLGGETGEVLEVLKKAQRRYKQPDHTELALELGDVLYYVTILAQRHNIPLTEIISRNVDKLESRKAIRFAKSSKRAK